MKKYSDSLIMGAEAEKSFTDTCRKNGIEISKSNKIDDSRNHIDFHFLLDEKRFSCDVKAMKKINRWDTRTVIDRIWIEYKNVRGDLGWLYGKADYICFEEPESFFCIRRSELIKFCDDHVNQSQYSPYKEPYKLYSREKYGRDDLCTIILREDLLSYLISNYEHKIGGTFFFLNK